MKALLTFLENVPRLFIFVVITVLAFFLAAGLTLGMGGGGNDENNVAPGITVEVASQTVAQAPPVTVTPTTVVPDHRTDCNAIRGTEYRSDAERDWFAENCGPDRVTASNASSTTSTGGSTGTTSTAPASTSHGTTSSAASGLESPTGQTLVIPKANVNADIYITKMTGSKMPDPKGYFYAVSYDMSDYPGLGGDVNSGNLVMSGHVDCGRCYNGGAGTAIFWSVRQLSVGDTAQVYTADGRVVNYVVSHSGAYSSGVDFSQFVASNAADLTIITCTGTFSGGEYDNRHVVQFRKV